MTPEQVKSKVRKVLRLMKPEWIEALFCFGEWGAYTPFQDFASLKFFSLPPFPGDWKDSLVRREE